MATFVLCCITLFSIFKMRAPSLPIASHPGHESMSCHDPSFLGMESELHIISPERPDSHEPNYLIPWKYVHVLYNVSLEPREETTSRLNIGMGGEFDTSNKLPGCCI